MNHSFEVYSINYSNSDRSRSPGASSRSSSRLESEGRVMNRDHSQNDSDDGTKKDDKQAMVPLHKDFAPGDHDVICGRGKKCYAHTGNERFRQIVQSHLDQYSAATSRPEKSEILSSIVSQVRTNSPDGGFVKRDTATGTWYEVGDFLAREKTSQAFRDALHEHYRSSKKSKHEKRRQRTQAKSMSEKQAAKGSHELDHGDPQALYPSPLVSRQQLTVLREEGSHPRAFSFSAGRSHEPRVREMQTRALSLSSGRSGGRLGDRIGLGLASDQFGMAYREPSYHRSDSAPEQRSFGERFGERYSVDNLVEPGPRLRDQMESGHESWPQPYHTSSRSPFIPPVAPQFHPVRPEDVAAHRPPLPDADADAIMAEVDSVKTRGISNQRPRWPEGELDSERPSRRQRPREETHASPSRSFAAPLPLNAFSGNDPSRGGGTSSSSARRYASTQPESAAHQRSDSTASASVIVAHLASALQPDSLAPDDNPFEPIPLAGRSKKKPKTDSGDHGKW